MMLDNDIVSSLFESAHMDLNLSCHLSLISRQFLLKAQAFQRKLTEVDLKLVCNNYVFQDRVLRWISGHLPQLQSIRNVKAAGSEALDSLQALTTMPNLTSVHFTYFQLKNANVAYLFELPKLDSFSADHVSYCYEFNSSRIEHQLQLSHVHVDLFDFLEGLLIPPGHGLDHQFVCYLFCA